VHGTVRCSVRLFMFWKTVVLILIVQLILLLIPVLFVNRADGSKVSGAFGWILLILLFALFYFIFRTVSLVALILCVIASVLSSLSMCFMIGASMMNEEYNRMLEREMWNNTRGKDE